LGVYDPLCAAREFLSLIVFVQFLAVITNAVLQILLAMGLSHFIPVMNALDQSFWAWSLGVQNENLGCSYRGGFGLKQANILSSLKSLGKRR